MTRALPFLLLVLTAAGASAQGLAGDFAPPDDLTAPPADAATSATGLKSKVLGEATRDEKPAATDVVTVHYTGWASDGQMIDSSLPKGTPVMFPLGKTMAGLKECVQLMGIGERRRCWIPQDLAYRGRAGQPSGTVVFDIELVDTRPYPVTPPADVKEMPSDATKTASGLGFKVLRQGTGVRNPSAFGSVTVHYTGWTTDGKMFDSSVVRGQTATLGLDMVIAGWTEGMQLMIEGERRRFWIPEELAYKGEAGSPKGMLVFDVELVRIE